MPDNETQTPTPTRRRSRRKATPAKQAAKPAGELRGPYKSYIPVNSDNGPRRPRVNSASKRMHEAITGAEAGGGITAPQLAEIAGVGLKYAADYLSRGVARGWLGVVRIKPQRNPVSTDGQTEVEDADAGKAAAETDLAQVRAEAGE